MEEIVHFPLAVVGDQVEDVPVVIRQILHNLGGKFDEMPLISKN